MSQCRHHWICVTEKKTGDYDDWQCHHCDEQRHAKLEWLMWGCEPDERVEGHPRTETPIAEEWRRKHMDDLAETRAKLTWMTENRDLHLEQNDELKAELAEARATIEEIRLEAGYCRLCGEQDEWTALTKINVELRAKIEKLRDALEFYADPANYHAISFIGDRPCGGFIDDFSEDHGDDFYDRAMPGKQAREILGDEERTS